MHGSHCFLNLSVTLRMLKYDCMRELDSLQIGHLHTKASDFKIEYEAVNDRHVEVPFSHRHIFYAVYWVHVGCGKHVIDFKEYDIKPGRVFFIKPEQVHFFHVQDSTKFSALQFTEEFMMPFLHHHRMNISVCMDLSPCEAKRMDVLFRQLQDEASSNLPNSNGIVQSEINTLLLELERISCPANNLSAVPEVLSKYQDLIDAGFKQDRQVGSYAVKLGISPNYLNVLARKYLGRSALELINDRVVLEAKRMLVETQYDISEIAFKLGFNELSYFSRFFRQHTGSTPLDFRISMNEMYQR